MCDVYVLSPKGEQNFLKMLRRFGHVGAPLLHLSPVATTLCGFCECVCVKLSYRLIVDDLLEAFSTLFKAFL